MKTSFKFVQNQVNGYVSGLHCTWLVPRTRASSDDVDGFLTLRVDPLEEGRSTLRAWPNLDMGVRLFVIMHSYGVWLVLTAKCRNLVSMASFWGSGLCPWSPTVALHSPTVALHVLLNLGIEAAVMCLDLLRLPSCARNPHITAEVLGMKFLDRISPEGHVFILVLIGTQIPYSATVDLVTGLGYHRWYQSI
ncbi:hypothetical protein M9H77_36359 [Catharanthus roseus]|uniref:Uncharacterized protein n=1 Tax=Catharanthus roseus TaxID=4058 RepID=A0ACB9ZTD7_CATRO|nr:hypothetical protein M9H77_36359 [Catharanthus roseus]